MLNEKIKKELDEANLSYIVDLEIAKGNLTEEEYETLMSLTAKANALAGNERYKLFAAERNSETGRFFCRALNELNSIKKAVYENKDTLYDLDAKFLSPSEMEGAMVMFKELGKDLTSIPNAFRNGNISVMSDYPGNRYVVYFEGGRITSLYSLKDEEVIKDYEKFRNMKETLEEIERTKREDEAKIYKKGIPTNLVIPSSYYLKEDNKDSALCPNCKDFKKTRVDHKTVTFNGFGTEVSVDTDVLVCAECGEEIFDTRFLRNAVENIFNACLDAHLSDTK